jgi:AraC-like DNA-binding protein
MLYMAGIIITFFLAVILASRKGKAIADRVLAAWLCLMGFHLFLYYWQITEKIYEYPWLLAVGIPFPLLHGPFLYIYTLSVTRYSGFPKKNWLHFIPGAVAYIILAKFFMLTPEQKISVYKNQGAGFETQTAVIFFGTIISGFAYVVLSFYELRKYRRSISEELSNTERVNLNWLRYLIYGILAIWLIIFIDGDDSLIYAAVVVFVFLLGFFGIRHTDIFTYRQVILKGGPVGVKQNPDHTARDLKENLLEDKEFPAVPVADEARAGVKYEKSGLQKAAADKIHFDLNQLMNEKKLFKNEELSLSELAQVLGVHPNNLSQVINTYENKNFYDYINTLRIEEFKTLALSPENSNYTLLSLAFECGFNSKTSFNRNFKKITGESPSAYLKASNVELVAG